MKTIALLTALLSLSACSAARIRLSARTADFPVSLSEGFFHERKLLGGEDYEIIHHFSLRYSSSTFNALLASPTEADMSEELAVLLRDHRGDAIVNLRVRGETSGTGTALANFLLAPLTLGLVAPGYAGAVVEGDVARITTTQNPSPPIGRHRDTTIPKLGWDEGSPDASQKTWTFFDRAGARSLGTIAVVGGLSQQETKSCAIEVAKSLIDAFKGATPYTVKSYREVLAALATPDLPIKPGGYLDEEVRVRLSALGVDGVLVYAVTTCSLHTGDEIWVGLFSLQDGRSLGQFTTRRTKTTVLGNYSYDSATNARAMAREAVRGFRQSARH